MKLAIVGATGLVGSTMLQLIEELQIPVDTLIPVASEKSVGTTITFKGEKIKVVSVEDAIALKPAIALFSAGGSVSLSEAPKFAAIGCYVIDNSSAWRMDPTKKLIVPEVNGHVLEKTDYIIANPPFNVSNWHPEDLPENDPRLFGARDEYTTDGSANYMWMQTFWHHLSDTGTAGIVMANGAMTSNTKGEKNVRQHMVDNSMIDCIVRMPDKLFLTTGIPACLFILSKNRDGKDGKHRERHNEILFLDASKLGTMASRKLRVFSNEDVKTIADTYHHWRKLSNTFTKPSRFSKRRP